MSRKQILFVLFWMLPAMATAQSLGELAKKEKKRRDKNKEEGVQVRVVSEREVSTVTSDENDLTEASEDEESVGATPTEEPSALSPGQSASDRREEELSWRGRVSEARARLEAAQQRYDSLAGLHLSTGEYYVDENGRPVITSLDQLRRMVAEAEAELGAARKALDDLLEGARRAGVPPGWLR